MARHPNKEIEAALRYARELGWSVLKSSEDIAGA